MVAIADLAQDLKDATGPSYWEGEGTAMRLDEIDVITVCASPSMHGRIVQVLDDLRRLAGQRRAGTSR